mmetsp:Transcript_47903/g.95283  ORF Transcript_47903/g.95283 Transcript_47903/m.95283 type:complete len:268 (+) Transcript_47903:482-1285(+)
MSACTIRCSTFLLLNSTQLLFNPLFLLRGFLVQDLNSLLPVLISLADPLFSHLPDLLHTELLTLPSMCHLLVCTALSRRRTFLGLPRQPDCSCNFEVAALAHVFQSLVSISLHAMNHLGMPLQFLNMCRTLLLQLPFQRSNSVLVIGGILCVDPLSVMHVNHGIHSYVLRMSVGSIPFYLYLPDCLAPLVRVQGCLCLYRTSLCFFSVSLGLQRFNGLPQRINGLLRATPSLCFRSMSVRRPWWVRHQVSSFNATVFHVCMPFCFHR